MDSFSLSAIDICRIIKACKETQVSELTFQGLTLKFQSHRNETVEIPRQGPDLPLVNDGFSETTATFLEEESASDEVEEAQLMIDNPVAFEKAQIRKHIERDRTQ